MAALNSLFFIILSLCFFTFPGILLLQKSKVNWNFWEKIIVATCIGFVLFSLISYLLLILRIPLLVWVIIPTAIFLLAKEIRNLIKSFYLPPAKQLILISIVFIFGIAGQMAIILPSGQISNNNLVFYSAHGHDGPWHMALMEELKKGYPWQNPVYAGEKLVNYHFFSDIAPTMFSYVPNLSSLDLYFRFFPLLYSLLLGGLAFILAKKIGGSFSAGLWGTVFTYFCGSFGYVFTLWQSHTISGESIFWATQIQSSSGNPPQIAALIIVLAFLYCFAAYLSNKNWMLFSLCTLLAGSLSVFKVYGGVVVLGSLGLVGLWQLIKDKNPSTLSLALSSGVLSLILYFPNTQNSTSFLILEPWWFIRTMVVATNRLNWLDLELQRQTYIADSNWKRVIQVETIAFLIFFVGNLGMRILGIFPLAKLARSLLQNYFSQMIITILCLSFIFPILFLQKGVASNTIQFLQYFLLIFGILGGVAVASISSKLQWLSLKISFIILVILLAIPTQLGLIYDFYKNPPISKISAQELQALKFLKERVPNNSIVMVPNFDQNLNIKNSTPPIWAWFDTAYVSALSGKRVYLADYEQVDIMGYDLKKRQQIQKDIFNEETPQNFVKQLELNNIHVVYFPKSLAPMVDLNKTGLKPLYQNEDVEIWQVL